MANNKKNDTSFSSNTQPIKRRGKSTRTKLLEALKRAGHTEEGFLDTLIEKAFDSDDSFTFKELLTRLAPVDKAVAPMVEFDFPKDAKPHEQAGAVMEAVSNGIVPPDIGNMFIASIKSMIDIEEYTDLKDRIERIEKSLGVSCE